MMERKILSIVLPTYNRAKFLPRTLSAFQEQMERNRDKVSFLVCDNASTDGSEEILKTINKKWPYFEYKIFEEHVDVGYSIARANSTATGEYILMWGDDDLPAPYFLDTVLDYIEKYNHPALIHYNRLWGYDNNVKRINKLAVLDRNIGDEVLVYNSMNGFLQDHVLDITFLSAIIFKSECWFKNIHLDTTKHFGYEFLGKILHGFVGDIIYIQYPLCIQRKPFNRPWMNKSPYYRFIGIPNMYSDFEKWGLVDSWKSLWMKRGNSTRDFLSIMAQTSIFKKEYRPLFRKLLDSQFSLSRKFLTFCFVYIVPAFIYKNIRKQYFK